MDYIDGHNLGEEIARGSYEPESGSGREHRQEGSFQDRIARLMIALCEAVQHAHQHGVIHRDLKPANVLIDRAGEPHLTDFGLARRLDVHSELTMTGQTLGSPHYMPPEQVSGDRKGSSIAGDVYSLGAILYHLLTGRPPYEGATLAEVLRSVVDRPPLPPRTLRPAVDPVMEVICLKCLEKQPARRYASALDLGADLQRWRDGRPILARPVSIPEQFVLWSKRNRALAVALGGLVVTAWTGMALVIGQSARRQRALVDARQSLYMARIQAAQSAYERGNVARARSLLDGMAPARGELDLRGFEWQHLWNVSRDESVLTLSNVSDSPLRGFVVDSAGGTLATGDAHGLLHLYRTADGEYIRSFPAVRGDAYCLDFSPDNQSILVGGAGLTVAVCPASAGQPHRTLAITNPVSWFAFTCVRLASDGETVVACGQPGAGLYVWSLRSPEELARFHPMPGEVRHFSLHPDSRSLAMNMGDDTVRILEVGSMTETRRLSGHRSAVTVVEYSPDGRHLASGEAEGAIRIERLEGGPETKVLPGRHNVVKCLAFTPDGRTLVSGCLDGIIRIWDLGTRAELKSLRGHSAQILSMAMFPDGRRFATASEDGTVKIWDLPERQTRPGFESEPLAWDGDWVRVRFSPDGTRFASQTPHPFHHRLWRADNGLLVASIPGARELGAFSTDSKYFAGGDDQGSIHVLEASTGRGIASWSVSTQRIESVAFSPSGEILAVSGLDGVLHRWDVRTLEKLPSWEGYEGGVQQLVPSPDGSFLAVICREGNVRLRDWRTGRHRASIPHGSEIPRLGIASDGSRLWLSEPMGGAIGVWDTRTGERTHRFGSRMFWGCAPDFSPDGLRIAVPGEHTRVEIRDLPTGTRIMEMNWPGTWPGHVAFSPDSRTVVACDGAGIVRFFNLAIRREVLTLSVPGSFGGANFSPDGKLLVIHNHLRNNLLLRATPPDFADADLRSRP